MNAAVHIRRGTACDLAAIEAALFEAIHWNAGEGRPSLAEYRVSPGFGNSLDEWGKRPGDAAVLAEIDDRSAGAAWYRFWTPENHSWGFVDAATPELGIGVAAQFRGQGVGRALMVALLAIAREAGLAAISLSVDPQNFAIELYRSLGFRPVGASGTSVTMLRGIGTMPATGFVRGRGGEPRA